jgi:Na+/melibiose symporter-like transporter
LSASDRPATLWRHSDFVKLWAGQTVSIFGSMLTRIALPLTALLTLNSGPLQQGLLQAVEAAPALAAGLFVGVWADRLRRRPLMIAADLARAGVLLSIPATAFAGRLTMAQLYLVAAFAALFTMVFDAAYPAYLPTLIGRERVVEGNAGLTASASVAEIGGFAGAGALVQYLSGPAAVLIDAATFIVSAFSLAWIRSPEPAPVITEHRRHLMTELTDGLRVIWRDRTVRALVACWTTISIAGGGFGAMYLLYAVRDLALSPAAAGAIAACGGFGSLAGSALAAPAMRQFGPKATLVLGFGLGGAFQMLVPLAHGTPGLAATYLIVAQVVGDGLITIAMINGVSLRQMIVSDRFLGRVSSTANVLRVLAMPIGALAAGVVGQAASPRVALVAAALIFSLGSLWIAAAPMGRRED